MNTITLWILIFSASGNRPAVVVERFESDAACRAAKVQIEQIDKAEWTKHFPFCLRVEVPK